MNLAYQPPPLRHRRRLLAGYLAGTGLALLAGWSVTAALLLLVGGRAWWPLLLRSGLEALALLSLGLLPWVANARALGHFQRERISVPERIRLFARLVHWPLLMQLLVLAISLAALAVLLWRRQEILGMDNLGHWLLIVLLLSIGGVGAVLGLGQVLPRVVAALELSTPPRTWSVGLRARTLAWMLLAALIAAALALLLDLAARSRLNSLPSLVGIEDATAQVLAWALSFTIMAGWFLGEEIRSEPLLLLEQLRRLEPARVDARQLQVPASSPLGRAAVACSKLVTRLAAGNDRLRRYAERARRTERLRRRFLAGVSHELRTPLNGIIGYADLLAGGFEGRLNDEQRQAVAVIEQEGERLHRLINELLQLARIEAGREQAEPATVSANRLLELLADLKDFLPVAVAPDLDTDELTRLRVNVDQQRLVAALQALQKMHGGDRPARAQLSRQGGRLVLEVVLPGSGLAAGENDKLLAFASARHHARHATGLELPLAAALVRLAGGEVRVADHRDETLQISLPLAGR